MIVNLYDRQTGRFTHRGLTRNPKIQRLISQGYIAVENETWREPNYRKYDFGTGTTVPDDARRAAELDAGKEHEPERDRIWTILDAYRQTSHAGRTPDQRNTMEDALIDAIKLIWRRP